jgi:hypothetical protein
MTTMSECGYKVKLRKVLHAPEIPGWALIGGKAVHSATEAKDFLRFGIKTDKPTTFMGAFEEEIAYAKKQEGCPPEEEWHAAGRATKEKPNKEDRKWWEANGQGLCDAWDRWLDRVPMEIAMFDGKPAIEMSFEDEFAGVPVIGFIDRILVDRDGVLQIVDEKSGSRKPKETGQLKTYARAIERKLGLATGAIAFGSFFMNREGAATVPVPLTVDDTLNYRYTEAWKAAQAGIFLPNVGFGCPSCSVRKSCQFFSGDDVAERFKVHV